MRARVRAVDSWVRAADSEGGEVGDGVFVTAMDVVDMVVWCVVVSLGYMLAWTRLGRGHFCRSLATASEHTSQCRQQYNKSSASRLLPQATVSAALREFINARMESPASEQSQLHAHSSSYIAPTQSLLIHICVCITTSLL